MTRTELLERLRLGPLVCDGGMGTQLIARGLTAGQCGETWNIQRPDDVASVHTDYLRAGCDLVTTNTFRGCGPALEMHGLADRIGELNRAAAALARRAADSLKPAGHRTRPIVLGDVGPFGGFLEPVGDMTPDRLFEVFREQIAALAEGGADGVIIETMSDPLEVAVAVRAARSVRADWPILATYAFEKPMAQEQPYRTMMGSDAEAALSAAFDAGADVAGANCGTSLSLEDYQRLAGDLVAAARGRGPVIVQPNAGSPVEIDGRQVHPAGPSEMADLALRLRKAGVAIIGGCCGTTPDHLRAMSAALHA